MDQNGGSALDDKLTSSIVDDPAPTTVLVSPTMDNGLSTGADVSPDLMPDETDAETDMDGDVGVGVVEVERKLRQAKHRRDKRIFTSGSKHQQRSPELRSSRQTPTDVTAQQEHSRPTEVDHALLLFKLHPWQIAFAHVDFESLSRLARGLSVLLSSLTKLGVKYPEYAPRVVSVL